MYITIHFSKAKHKQKKTNGSVEESINSLHSWQGFIFSSAFPILLPASIYWIRRGFCFVFHFLVRICWDMTLSTALLLLLLQVTGDTTLPATINLQDAGPCCLLVKTLGRVLNLLGTRPYRPTSCFFFKLFIRGQELDVEDPAGFRDGMEAGRMLSI